MVHVIKITSITKNKWHQDKLYLGKSVVEKKHIILQITPTNDQNYKV